MGEAGLACLDARVYVERCIGQKQGAIAVGRRDMEKVGAAGVLVAKACFCGQEAFEKSRGMYLPFHYGVYLTFAGEFSGLFAGLGMGRVDNPQIGDVIFDLCGGSTYLCCVAY